MGLNFRPKFLDAAVRDAQARAALERALHAAREEQEADSLWVREHGRDFALGFLSACLTGLLVLMIYFGVHK